MSLQEQINNSEFKPTESAVTMDDFLEMMKSLEFRVEEDAEPRKWVVVTGYGGYWTYRLNNAFKTFGKSKLPRKIKKRVYGTKKLRQQFLPEYYGK